MSSELWKGLVLRAWPWLTGRAEGHLLMSVMSGWVQRMLVVSMLWLLAACGWSGPGGWKNALELQTAQLGYRNWIVIAEASFPAHSRVGTRQVNSYQPIPVVLEEVLMRLEQTEHVRPNIYLPRELREVENDFAPGMDYYRDELKTALHGYEPIQLDQDSLLTLIQDARRNFDVLVIRTTTALPYSSVFLELQPGYWDGESETRLREQMQRRRMEKLASPYH